MRHVSKATLRAVLGGLAGKSETALVSRHVFGCQVCRKLSREVVAELRAEMRAQRPTARPGGALKVLAEIFTLETETSIDAALALAERAAMRQLTPKAQKDRAGISRICKSWTFVELLIRELSQQNSYEISENLGALIAICIQGMDPNQYSTELRKDLMAEMWIELANARRKAAEWARASKALDRSDSLLREGTGNVWLYAHFLEVRAAIQGDQGSQSEALADLVSSRDIYERVEDWPAVGRSLIQSANHMWESDPNRALNLVRQAVPFIPESDPGLLSIANLLQVDCLISLDQVPEAAGLFGVAMLRHETGRMRIRREFIGARLLYSSGYKREGERLFFDVISSDLDSGLYKDAFLDLLYVLNVHVEEGDLEKAAAICRRALSESELAAFSHDQIRAVWGLLLERVQMKAIERDLIKRAKGYMAAHWKHPASTFQVLGF